jgi:hypothetical protein
MAERVEACGGHEGLSRIKDCTRRRNMLLRPLPPEGKSIPMRLVRTILAFAIAASLAMLPLAASATGHAMSSDDMQTTMQMAGHADMSMDECCPDDMKGTASHTNSYKCGMGFCCIGGALALGDIRPIAFEFLTVAASKIAIPADQVVSHRGGSPPFRPPRI